MNVVAVTQDPALTVALSTRRDLGTVRVVRDPWRVMLDAGVTAAVLDVDREVAREIVLRWREQGFDLPVVVVGTASEGVPPGVRTVTRPLSVDDLAALLAEIERADPPTPPESSTSEATAGSNGPGARRRRRAVTARRHSTPVGRWLFSRRQRRVEAPSGGAVAENRLFSLHRPPQPAEPQDRADE